MADRELTGLPHDVSVTFPAKYDSNCRECDSAIYIGDPMGRVDGGWVCGDCHETAQAENRAALREQAEAQREADRAADPERFARMEAGAKHFLDAVRARAAQTPDKEWVELPRDQAQGWVRNPHYDPDACPHCGLGVTCECTPEPQPEQEAPVAVEPGIQALMAAGLLQGQEPGGSGVCVAEIHSAGKVVEVEIPVPVVAETVPAPVSGGDANQARREQLEAAAADWTPAQAQADALQASLTAAVDAGTMTVEQASGLGWMAPTVNVGGLELGRHDAAAVQAVTDPTRPGATTPGPWDPPQRTELARAEFRADPERAAADIFLDALAAATSGPEEQAVLDTLDALPAYVGRDNMEAEKRDLLNVILDAINNHPRSLQVKIGPSEIGTECDHCLAAKLAGWRETERGEAWLPTVGTAVHSWIEDAFNKHPEGPNGTRRFLTERRVAVGEIDGMEVTGSTDLVDVVAGWTWDWKIVGPTTLKSAKVRPSRRYVVQQMLYARGWNRLGVKITHVGIAYLPRNAMTLTSGVWWSAPYDPEIAEQALERATGIARNLKAMEAIGGTETRDKYISGLDRWRQYTQDGLARTGNSQEGRIICTDCPRYPDMPAGEPGAPEEQLDGLL